MLKPIGGSYNPIQYPTSYEDNRGENSIIWKLIQRGKDLPEAITDYNPSYRFPGNGTNSLSNLDFLRGNKELLWFRRITDYRIVWCRGIYLWFYSTVTHSMTFQTWGYRDLDNKAIPSEDKEFTVQVNSEGKYFYLSINAYMQSFGLTQVSSSSRNAYCYLTGIKFDADF